MSVHFLWTLGASVAGYYVGSLSRQPEINKLKNQVKLLQKEVERLQQVICIQNSQINELKIRYTTLKGWQYIEKNKQRGYIKGSLMFEYALKEYLEMLISANVDHQVRMKKTEVCFFNAFDTILNEGEITEKNRKIVIGYVKEKYGSQIDEFIEPDLSSIIDALK